MLQGGGACPAMLLELLDETIEECMRVANMLAAPLRSSDGHGATSLVGGGGGGGGVESDVPTTPTGVAAATFPSVVVSSPVAVGDIMGGAGDTDSDSAGSSDDDTLDAACRSGSAADITSAKDVPRSSGAEAGSSGRHVRAMQQAQEGGGGTAVCPSSTRSWRGTVVHAVCSDLSLEGLVEEIWEHIPDTVWTLFSDRGVPFRGTPLAMQSLRHSLRLARQLYLFIFNGGDWCVAWGLA